MQRGHHQVARERIRNRRGHRLAVADLADQDHIRRLAQGVAQRDLHRRRVAPDLALVDDRLLVREQKLDRVFDRQDMPGHLLVAPFEHRRQRRALAGAGGANHQQQAALFENQGRQRDRHAQRVERRNLGRDAAEYRRQRATLAKRREPETADLGDADADVELVAVFELLELLRRQQLAEQRAHLRRRDELIAELHDLPVDLDQDRRLCRDVDVGGAFFRHQAKHLFHISAHAGLPAHRLRTKSSRRLNITPAATR